MARKKKADEQPKPEEKPRKKDRHASGRMVRLSEWIYQAMKRAAARHGRPMTWEMRKALVQYLESLGEEVPEEEKK